MTGALLEQSTQMWWSRRRSRRLLVAVHLPFFALGPVITLLGLEDPARPAFIVVPLAFAIAALQLRHSFAAARGVLPTFWPATLVALGVLIYVPMYWFGVDWASTQWMFIASVAMLLRGPLMKVLIVGPLVGTALLTAINSQIDGGPVTADVYFVLFWSISLTGGAICLYGATQLVRAVDALFETRADMADMTVGRERVRVSRDLHDLLGQSLSAVSLKGDLAITLLRTDPHAAQAEIRGLTEVAREAMRDIRDVVHGEHAVTLRSETQGAVALLAALSISADIDVQLSDLAPQVDELFGWATREGVTNMLCHSQAANCSIRATRAGGAALLEIINDGARSTDESGTGIASLTGRAGSLSGLVEAGLMRDGQYRLFVEVPAAFV